MLADALPASYLIWPLTTVAYEVKPLVHSAARPRTLKVRHFFVLVEKATQCVVFGLEVYVYLTFGLVLQRHIFVAKADTTGLGRRFSASRVVASLMEHLLSIDPKKYLEDARWRKRHVQTTVENTLEFPIVNTLRSLSRRDKKLVNQPPSVPDQISTSVSLFTRSAEAYIFPSSEENKGKHIADGNALFRWWLHTLSPILEGWRCTADIPGAEPEAVSRFLPGGWTQGNLFSSEEPAIRCIPVFPDDPKGRFLEHLVVEGRAKSVSGVQFWDELGYRQEFRLGSIVGIIGCSSEPAGALTKMADEELWRSHRVSLKEYKKFIEHVKSADYSDAGDVQDVVGGFELLIGPGVDITGRGAAAGHNGVNGRGAAVNNLTGLVRKKQRL